ncbi:MAG: phosphotransferase [Gammaproteobacteria bacterium]|nr:phosphotransferase [Gammaproteobacteria bacterium]
MPQDHRQISIQSWLKSVLPSPVFELSPASSDASFRRYFRVIQNQQSWIVMDAPPDLEDITSFVHIASLLYSSGINVPKIFAQDKQQGFLLLTDFGNTPYLQQLNQHSADGLYRKAIDSLIAIQLTPGDNSDLPLYDSARLQQEMALFPEWFLQRHMAIPSPDFIESIYQLLINNALEQPQVIVHRDYHSRNLMICNDGSAGIIDFQDAVIGPVTYDLVSLLRDCYIAWPQERIDQWLQYYYQQAQTKALLANSSFEQFKRWFDLMGIQRHLKVLGIFCRLNYRDGKTNYMNDLPLTMHYVKQVASQYPELDKLSRFLVQLPELETKL